MARVPMIARTALALSLSTALLAGCQPAGLPIAPGTQTPPVTTPGTNTPVQPGSPEPGAPAGPTAPLTALNAHVVIPAASVSKLRSSMRAQSVADETAQALGALHVYVDGQRLNADQFSFTEAGYDSMGRLTTTLKVSGFEMAPGAIITLSTVTGSFALKSVVSASGSGMTVDVGSTAKALIVEQMQKDGKTVDPDAIPAASIDLVAAKLTNLLTGSANVNVLSASNLVSAISQVANAVADGKGANTDTLNQISQNTGGGGGSSSSSYAPKLSVKALDWRPSSSSPARATTEAPAIDANFDGGTHMAEAAASFAGSFDVQLWNTPTSTPTTLGKAVFAPGFVRETGLTNLTGFSGVTSILTTDPSYNPPGFYPKAAYAADLGNFGPYYEGAENDLPLTIETTFLLNAQNQLKAVSNFIGPKGAWWAVDPEQTNSVAPINQLTGFSGFTGATKHYYYKNVGGTVEFFFDGQGLLGAIIPNANSEITGTMVYSRAADYTVKSTEKALNWDVADRNLTIDPTFDGGTHLKAAVGDFVGKSFDVTITQADGITVDTTGTVTFESGTGEEGATTTLPVGHTPITMKLTTVKDYRAIALADTERPWRASYFTTPNKLETSFLFDGNGHLSGVSNFIGPNGTWWKIDAEMVLDPVKLTTRFAPANPDQTFAGATKHYYYKNGDATVEFFFDNDGLLGAIIPNLGEEINGYLILRRAVN